MLAGLEAELRGEKAAHVQRVVRRFLARCRLHRLLNARFEKIWDPRRGRFYYYDKELDSSSWARPRVLGRHDLKTVAPTYTRNEATTMIQRQLLRRVSLRRVRMLYQAAIISTFDEASGANYYYNPATGLTTWDLPKFMAGRMDYAYDKLARTVRWGPDGPLEDSDDDAFDSDDSSVDSAVVRQRRKLKRKFPRSKAQGLVDRIEDNFVSVRLLNLSGLGASRITSRVFEMTNLTSLSLANNQLGPRLSSDIQYLIKLHTLDLSHNNFERLPESMQELVVLRELRASHNLLSTFSAYLYKLATLQLLDLSHNLFKDLPVESGNLELFKLTRQWDVGLQCYKGLLVLNLNHNLFEQWPTQMDKCIRLKDIDLSYNMLTTVPNLVGQHTALTRLDLSFNRLVSVPTEIYQLPLQKLCLNNNLLADLPPLGVVLGVRMPELAELDISYNQLTRLDDRIGAFSGVKRFAANDNLISSIDDSIGNMAQVTHVNLARNQIEEMPAGFGGCKNLINLELQCNKLAVVPLCLSTMRNLAHLKMSDNQIVEATTQVFGSTSNMQTVDLRNNRIPKLPVTWYTMTKLTSVDVSFNCIEGPIARGLGVLKELETLLMRDNLITELPESISNLTNLRVLELENNRIAPSLPLGISRLQRLWRVTAKNNNFETAPEGLFHLPLLTSWDLSWNQRVVAQFIDWQQRESVYDEARDRMPVKILRRLLQRGWASLAEQKKPTKLDYIAAATAAAEASVGAEASSSSAAASIQQPTDDASKTNTSSTKKKREKKMSKKAKKEARRVRKQTLSEVMSWHNSLKAHFKSHLSIYRPVSKVAGAMARRAASGAAVASVTVKTGLSLATVAESTFLANEQRRTRTQLLSLFRTLRLTSARGARDPGDVADFGSSPVPDADLVESLDLGGRFQEAIALFETAARNICAAATLRYAQRAQERIVVARDAARRRREAKSSKSRKALFSISDETPDSATGPPSGSSSDLLALAIGATTTTDDDDDDDAAAADVDLDTLPNLCALPKSAFMQPGRSPPFLQHYPFLDSLDDVELHGFAFDAYLGLGTALLKRIDCLALAIRDVERRGRLACSLLNVAHRLEDDFEDLAADDFQDMLDRLAAAEELKGKGLVEKKKKRMAALMAKSGLADKEVEIDVGLEEDEETVKAKKESKKRGEIEQIEKNRLKARADSERQKKEDEERVRAAEEEARILEEEGGLADDDDDAVAATAGFSDPNGIHPNTANVVAHFLFEHRKLTLVWAQRALDAAAELLKMRGWDPAAPSFAKDRATMLERGSERLGRDAMNLHLARGRVHQLSDLYKNALEEYAACVVVSKGKFFRDMSIECIKARLADTDFQGARSALVDFITMEVPDADRRFPEPHELIKTERRLAMLLMLANSGIDQMRRGGVWAPNATISYRVQPNGLLARPAPIRECYELHRKRNPKDSVIISERLARVERENEAWAKNQDLDKVKDRIQNCMHKFSVVLEASREEMARIEEDLRAKAAAAEEAKKLQPVLASGGGGGGGGGGRGGRGGAGNGAAGGRGVGVAGAGVAGPGAGAGAGAGARAGGQPQPGRSTSPGQQTRAAGRGSAAGGRGGGGGRGGSSRSPSPTSQRQKR